MAGKAKIGAGIALDGEKEFKSAITGINKDLNVLKTALEKNKSEFEANGKSTNTLKDKLDLLSKQYDTQKSKIDTLSAALEKSKKDYAESGEKVGKLKTALSDAEEQMDSMKKSSSTTSDELNKQEKEVEKLKESLKKAEEGYQKADNKTKDWQSSLNKAESDLLKTKKSIDDTEGELKDFSTSAEKAGKEAKEAGNKAEKSSHDWSKLTSAVGKVSTAMIKVTAAAGAALGGLAAIAIKTGADFESGMSEVQAISQASASDLQLLKEKAKEMGAVTKFSASESADAFKYMAQAGWGTQDMLNGIDGVMSLAAASGEELALTSDIVTNSLTAFGLQAKDAARFSDVLAMTANATNTNVAEMGYTFKYVAPVAGALGYSIEDTSVAIGLMANSGIKAEQAGTTLRAMLTNLAKPTDQVDMYMKRLNISLTDSQGNVKPLNELLVEMRDRFSKLTDAQKAEYAAGIAGKEAMSGLLAIVNANDESFASLTTQINNSAGAADKAAKVMQDNLKGEIEQLGGACETLGIEFYESVDTPLRDITVSATNMVEQLTTAFKKGGLSSLISEFGNVFADVVVKAAENAPKMIDVAVNMVQSFLTGIQINSTKITDAAIKIGESLINGLSVLIPQVAKIGVNFISALASNLLGSEVGRSVKKLGDTIISSFKEIFNAVKAVFESLKPIFSTFVKTVANIANSVLPILTKSITFLTNNLKYLLPVITGIASAFIGWKVISGIIKTVSTATAVYSTIQTAFGVQMAISTGAITLQQAALGVLAGKISIVAAAQAAWNVITEAFKGPLGWLTLAIGGIVAVCTGVAIAMNQSSEEFRKNQKAAEEMGKTYSDIIQYGEEYKQTIESSASLLSNYDDKMMGFSSTQAELAEKMGDVQAEISAIAKVASDERRNLNDQEIARLQDLMNKLGELTQQSLDQQIARQKQAKTLAENQIKNFSGSQDEFVKLMASLNKTAQTEYDNTIKLSDETFLQKSSAANKMLEQGGQYNQAWLELQLKQYGSERQQTVTNAKTLLGETLTIQNEGFVQKSNGAIDYNTKILNIQEKALIETKNQLQAEKDLKEKYLNDDGSWKGGERIAQTYQGELQSLQEKHNERMNSIYAEGNVSLDEATKQQIGILIKSANIAKENGTELTGNTKLTLDTLSTYYKEMPEEMKTTFLDSFGDQKDILKQALEENNKAIEDAGKETAKTFNKTTEESLNSLQSAIIDGVPAVRGTVSDLFNAGFTDAVGNSLYPGLKVIATDSTKSLSDNIKDNAFLVNDAALEIGGKWKQGVAFSIQDGKVVILNQMQDVTDGISDKASQWPTIGEENGGKIMEGAKSSIDSGKEQVVHSVAQVNTDVETELGTLGEVGSQTGTTLTQNTADSINNGSWLLSDAAKNLTSTSETQISKLPGIFGGYGATSVSDLTKNLISDDPRKQVLSLNTAMDGALFPIIATLTRYGANSVDGVCAGAEKRMYDAKGYFAGAATSLAMAFKSSLGINSPSKVFARLAESIPKGIGVGIKQKSYYAFDAIKKVTKDMVSLSNDALNGISYNGVYDGLAEVKTAEANAKFNTPQNANYPTGQSPVVIHLNIERFNNQRPGDVQSFAQELDFYARNANLARGLV